jgi:hypothetical protein
MSVPKRRRIGKRGSRNRRIIAHKEIGAYEYTLHATKGWRKNRLMVGV